MIQGFEAQLQVALRALEEVVAPALGSAEKHVVEQLMLSIVTIGFVKTRMPDARRFYRMELRSWIDLAKEAEQVAGSPGVLTAAIAAGESNLVDPEADIAEFEAASRSLRDAVTALSASAIGQPYQAELERAILDRSGALVAQNRLWCTPFGFELQPESLPAAAW
jgi:hypothetical protein